MVVRRPADAAAKEPALEGQAATGVRTDESGKMIIPISLRGQVIGVIDLQEAEAGRSWTQQDLDLAQVLVLFRGFRGESNGRLHGDMLRVLAPTPR